MTTSCSYCLRRFHGKEQVDQMRKSTNKVIHCHDCWRAGGWIDVDSFAEEEEERCTA